MYIDTSSYRILRFIANASTQQTHN